MTTFLKATAKFLTARTSVNVALEFREWTLFGLDILIPMFSVAAKMCQDRANLLRSARHELATCERCHKLLSVKAARSFLMHLQDHHHIEAEDSYELVADVYRRMLKAHQTRDARKTISV